MGQPVAAKIRFGAEGALQQAFPQLAGKHTCRNQRHTTAVDRPFHHQPGRVEHRAVNPPRRDLCGGKPAFPFVLAVAAHQPLVLQILRTVEAGGNLRRAQHRQRGIKQFEVVGCRPAAFAKTDSEVHSVGGQINQVIVG
ncbi:hypothetical protein D3C78_1444410 [compost metagenome]